MVVTGVSPVPRNLNAFDSITGSNRVAVREKKYGRSLNNFELESKFRMIHAQLPLASPLFEN